MIEKFGNIWNMVGANAICITTNGSLKTNNEAVMGKGIAKEAVDWVPSLPKLLGRKIRDNGNNLYVFFEAIGHYYDGDVWYQDIVVFPTKHNWWEMSDMELIRRSCRQLMWWADELPHWEEILLPRPGVGAGRLKWEDVRREIEPILDDRVSVVTFYKS